MVPMARRDFRRRAITEEVHADMASRGVLPEDPVLAEQMIALEIRNRVRQSGRTNVSRAVNGGAKVGHGAE